MSAVMTSRSMPSLGTKYSFWRLEVGAAGAEGPVRLDMFLRRGAGVWVWRGRTGAEEAAHRDEVRLAMRGEAEGKRASTT